MTRPRLLFWLLIVAAAFAFSQLSVPRPYVEQREPPGLYEDQP